MFPVFKAHLPPPPAGVPSPMGWGDEATVRARLRHGFSDVRLTRRIALMRYPFPPAETVGFFRQYYGPSLKAFAALDAAGQARLHRDLVELKTTHNFATTPGTTEVAAEYLEVVALLVFGYCLMARTVSLLPWNRAEPLTLDLLRRTFFSAPVVMREEVRSACGGLDGVCEREARVASLRPRCEEAVLRS